MTAPSDTRDHIDDMRRRIDTINLHNQTDVAFERALSADFMPHIVLIDSFCYAAVKTNLPSLCALLGIDYDAVVVFFSLNAFACAVKSDVHGGEKYDDYFTDASVGVYETSPCTTFIYNDNILTFNSGNLYREINREFVRVMWLWHHVGNMLRDRYETMLRAIRATGGTLETLDAHLKTLPIVVKTQLAKMTKDDAEVYSYAATHGPRFFAWRSEHGAFSVPEMLLILSQALPLCCGRRQQVWIYKKNMLPYALHTLGMTHPLPCVCRTTTTKRLEIVAVSTRDMLRAVACTTDAVQESIGLLAGVVCVSNVAPASSSTTTAAAAAAAGK